LILEFAAVQQGSGGLQSAIGDRIKLRLDDFHLSPENIASLKKTPRRTAFIKNYLLVDLMVFHFACD
jgi:hypothetical protein